MHKRHNSRFNEIFKKNLKITLDLIKQSKNQEELSFRLLDSENKGYITREQLISALETSGINYSSNEVKNEINKWAPQKESIIDYDKFHTIMNIKSIADYLRPEGQISKEEALTMLQKALTQQLIVPDWSTFCKIAAAIFDNVKETISHGNVVSYIPLLSKENPEIFGLSICTVDGQEFHYGDADHEFTMQSCASPLVYLLALEQVGEEIVHKYIGREPSGQAFNSFTLNPDKPHNPLINSGAIITCSLLSQNMSAADRFDKLRSDFKELSGGYEIGFSQATYLSEKDTADINFALAYYLVSAGCAPDNVDIRDALDFYFQTCSMEVTCSKMAKIAATLANGGISPITHRRCASAKNVKNVIQVMYSCGMSDYSGTWSCSVGIPAKSGVSGGIMLIVPNIMGIAIYSPRVDSKGNSIRGVEYSKRLAEIFSLGIFDQVMKTNDKIDPKAKSITLTEQLKEKLKKFGIKLDIEE